MVAWELTRQNSRAIRRERTRAGNPGARKGVPVGAEGWLGGCETPTVEARWAHGVDNSCA